MKRRFLALLTIQILASQELAEAAAPAPAFFDPASGLLNADTSLHAIGPLHFSNGKVLIKDNVITVLSDVNDSQAEAELSGALLNCHLSQVSGAPTVTGLAVFTKGLSVSALDNFATEDVVQVTDGVQRAGQIVELTPKMLRLRTKQGMQILPISKVTAVESPHAFIFSLNPDATASGGVVSLSNANQISFTGTTLVAAAPNTSKVKPLHAQLSERHVGKQVVKLGVFTTALMACFLIPLGVACITPRPKSTPSTGGGGGGSGSGSGSSGGSSGGSSSGAM